VTYKALRNIIKPEDLGRFGQYLSSKNNEENERLATEHIQANWPVPYIVKLNDDPGKAELRSFIINAEDEAIDKLSVDEYASSHEDI
jgi:hypothetical protein